MKVFFFAVFNKRKDFFTDCVCLAFSACYELFEWAMLLLPENPLTPFRVRGDVWDTQTDMLLALVWAIAAFVLLSKLHEKQLNAHKTKKERKFFLVILVRHLGYQICSTDYLTHDFDIFRVKGYLLHGIEEFCALYHMTAVTDIFLGVAPLCEVFSHEVN